MSQSPCGPAQNIYGHFIIPSPMRDSSSKSLGDLHKPARGSGGLVTFGFVGVANGVSIIKIEDTDETENTIRVPVEVAFFPGCVSSKRELHAQGQTLYAVHDFHDFCACTTGNCSLELNVQDPDDPTQIVREVQISIKEKLK